MYAGQGFSGYIYFFIKLVHAFKGASKSKISRGNVPVESKGQQTAVEMGRTTITILGHSGDFSL